MEKRDQFSALPGGALIRQGLDDLRKGRATVPALVLEVARGRLARAGLLPAGGTPAALAPELRLYRLLRAEGGDAYSRYNALLRELSSFLQAFEHQARKDTPRVSSHAKA